MEEILIVLAATMAGYLSGSFPSAYLVTRLLRGVDVRTIGSRNPGAVNVFRHVSPAAAGVVLALDAAKAVAVVLTGQALGLGDAALFSAAIAVVVGHNWPVFLNFRGGKGVAAVMGLSLAILPVWTLIAVGLAVAAGLATRSVVFGVAAGIVAINVFTFATGQDTIQIVLCLTLSALVVGTHYAIAFRDVREAVRAKGAWGLFVTE